MPGPNWNDEEDKALRCLVEQGLSAPQIARQLGRTTNAINNRLRRLGLFLSEVREKRFHVQQIPTANRPLNEVIAAQAEAFRRKNERHESKQGIVVSLEETAPYGVLFFGDPHIGDNGCDIELLCHHISLVKETPGLYGVNIGDLTNNWVGKLGRLYAHQHTTDDEEIELARWMIGEIPWLFVILGNHDKWSAIAQMLCQEASVAYVSHGGRFVVRCGTHELKIDARHDHQGRSQFNPAHGQIRRSYRGSDARVIVGGHIHQGAYTRLRNGVTGNVSDCIRLGAYKVIDEFADSKNFDADDLGPACLVTVDPSADSVQCWWDVDEGVRYLGFLRGQSESLRLRPCGS